MLAGILRESGYFMGDKLHAPVKSNPKGFFEWPEINRINEQILLPLGDTFAARLVGTIYGKNLVRNPGNKQRWLMSLPVNVRVQNDNPALLERIRRVTALGPFCYKDPRFCYTLPVWKPFLQPDTAFICVFRKPQVTAESILKECRAREYLKDLYINRRLAFQVWRRMYSHILAWNTDVMHRFFFVHYDQVYDGTAMKPLSQFLDVKLSDGFVDRSLKRSAAVDFTSRKAETIYRRLCELAGYHRAN